VDLSDKAVVIEATQKVRAADTPVSRNIIWNLAGEIAPVLAALVSIPLLVRGLGAERFGILTLAWALVSYLNLFDIGLGRALTKFAADKLAAGSAEELSTLFWTASLLMLILSFVGSYAMVALTPWLVYRELAIPVALRSESLRSFYLLAFSLPLVITTSAFRGMLSAFHRFDLLNAVRIPLGICTFISPLLVLPFSRSLVPTVAALVVVRLMAWFAYLCVSALAAPATFRFQRPRFEFVRDLLSFGGWITVSSIVSPAMLYCDRFLIGTELSTAAVAYYSTPCDMVLRLSVVPTAVAAVLFPAFAKSYTLSDSDRLATLISRGSNFILMIMFPGVLLVVVLAPESLNVWLGRDFSEHGAVVMQWLAAGILVNSLAHLPFALIQSAHRPDLTAKLSLFELPLYFLLLFWLVHRLGLEGVAIAWTIRLSSEAVALWLFAQALVPRIRSLVSYNFQLLVGAIAVVAVGAMLPQILVLKLTFLVLTLSAFALTSWFFFLIPNDRQWIFVGLRTFYRSQVGESESI
jgi:O-antigen/teichoic acid export membrane protein